MLVLISNILDDGIKQNFYTLKNSEDKFCINIQTLDGIIENYYNNKDEDYDSNFTLSKGIELNSKIPTTKIFRNSESDYLTDSYDEESTLFWLLNKLRGARVKTNKNPEFINFNYTIGPRVNNILLSNNKKLTEDLILTVDKSSLNNESVIKYAEKSMENEIIFRLKNFPITNIDLEVFSSVVTEDIIFMYYLYTAIPMLCEELVLKQKNILTGNNIKYTDSLREFTPSMQSINNYNDTETILDVLNNSSYILDKTRYNVLADIANYDLAELESTQKKLQEEYFKRKQLLFKMKYLYTGINSTIFLKTKYGKLDIKERR